MPDTQTLALTDFLLARIAEDEAQFRDWKLLDDLVDWQVAAPATRTLAERGLAECEAKRRIVDKFPHAADGDGWNNAGEEVLCILAAIYADHPDYRSEWAA